MALGITIPFTQPPQTLTRVVLTLATISGTILAIVFSVTFVGFQLVADTHAGRAAPALVRDGRFQQTFALFGVVVVGSIVGLYAGPYLAPGIGADWQAVASGLILGVIVLGIAASYELVEYVTTMVERLNPESVIELLLETDLAPESLFGAYPSVKAIRDDPTHPFESLITMVRGGLDDGQTSTVELGLGGIERAINAMIAALPESSIDDSSGYVDALIEPLVKNTYEDMLIEASRFGHRRVVYRIAESVETITIAGLSENYHNVLQLGLDGLGSAIVVAHDEDIDLWWPYRTVTDRMGDILNTAVDTTDPIAFVSVWYHLIHPYVILLRRNETDHNLHDQIFDFCGRVVPQFFEKFVKEYNGKLVASPEVWLGGSTESNAVRAIRNQIRYLGTLYNDILRYYGRTGELPFGGGNPLSVWTSMFNKSLEAELDGLAVTVGLALLSFGYQIERIGARRPNGFADTFARCQLNYELGVDVVDNVFTYAAEGTFPRKARPDAMSHLHTKPDPQGIVSRLIGNEDNDGSTFEEWLSEFQKEVAERRKELQEGYEWDVTPER
ncbi:hypothetical protein [Halosegnis marinus]|uniref:Uncharacterized protein n=1 Tax=Halosegnis marinus TaxID=3034023 RepID=A0ABD5ZT18_9EURY|nr:hypothetical protein [Halosegnis sp. DT85]